MSDTLNKETEFDQMPVEEAVAQIEARIAQLDVSEPSTDAIAEIRDAISLLTGRLGESMDDEETLGTGTQDRLQQLEQTLEDIAR